MNGTYFMLKNRKKGSVFIQSWFVFLLFLVMYNHYQTQIWWRNKATIEFKQAQETIFQHIEAIELLRNRLESCIETLEDCHIQHLKTKNFKYEIEFDLQNYQVLEIKIFNH